MHLRLSSAHFHEYFREKNIFANILAKTNIFGKICSKSHVIKIFSQK
jgi:hypothetical protein